MLSEHFPSILEDGELMKSLGRLATSGERQEEGQRPLVFKSLDSTKKSLPPTRPRKKQYIEIDEPPIVDEPPTDEPSSNAKCFTSVAQHDSEVVAVDEFTCELASDGQTNLASQAIPIVMGWATLRNEYDDEGNTTVSVYNNDAMVEMYISAESYPPTFGPFTLHAVRFLPLFAIGTVTD